MNKNFLDAYDRVADALRHVEATLDHTQFEASGVATDHLGAIQGGSDLDASNVERLDRLCMGCAAGWEYIRYIAREMDALRRQFLGEPPALRETPQEGRRQRPQGGREPLKRPYASLVGTMQPSGGTTSEPREGADRFNPLP